MGPSLQPHLGRMVCHQIVCLVPEGAEPHAETIIRLAKTAMNWTYPCLMPIPTNHLAGVTPRDSIGPRKPGLLCSATAW